MKKKIAAIVCVLLGVLALAGETALLLRAKQNYVSERRQEYASELKGAVLKLSASLRMGETEHFDEALIDYDTALEKISPYLKDDEEQKLTKYRTALEAQETKDLIKLNATLLKVKDSLREAKELDGLEDEPELKQLNDTFLRLKTCEVYCSAKDYREIEKSLTEESEKLKQKQESLEQENTVRLGSEEIIAWLDMLK